MRRRVFIKGMIGSVAGWPLAATAQQAQMPVVGMLSGTTPTAGAALVSLQAGLKEEGFVEGQNVQFEYRFANGNYDELPTLAADLVDKHVAVIATMGDNATKVAQTVSAGRVPVVFAMGDDPVSMGIVASMNRPGGSITGSSSINNSLGAKRMELLYEFLPRSSVVALLSNPGLAGQLERRDTEVQAQAFGLRLKHLTASTVAEIDTAFTTLDTEKIAGLLIASDTFFFGEIKKIASLASRYRVPAIGPLGAFADAGGLMSYGANIPDVIRQTGVYVGRVLKGDKPSELPIMQPSKFDLVINLQTAKALGIAVPQTLLAVATRVIE
jgi:putative ABC transport system substrate-binding protein